MKNEPHYHEDEQGIMVKCFHQCKTVITDWRFILGVTISYPFEHYLWTNVPPFSWLGTLIIGH